MGYYRLLTLPKSIAGKLLLMRRVVFCLIFSISNSLFNFRRMMLNTLRHDRDNLANISQTQLLTVVLNAVKKLKLFDAREASLTIFIDTIATEAIENLKKTLCVPF
jgi:hypothetical protein